MPPVVAAAAVTAGATIAGSMASRSASNRATAASERGTMAALAEERARREEERAQWEANQAFEREKFAATEEERLNKRRLEDEREVRRAPYRQAGHAALGNLGKILGFQVGPYQSGGGTGGLPRGGLKPLPEGPGDMLQPQPVPGGATEAQYASVISPARTGPTLTPPDMGPSRPHPGIDQRYGGAYPGARQGQSMGDLMRSRRR